MTTTRAVPASTTRAWVRDPICGMELDPQAAFATRSTDGDTTFFCSAHCVAQFDRARRPSATTGVAPNGDTTPVRIDLPLTNPLDRHSATALEQRLLATPGVLDTTVNGASKTAQITYDPQRTDLAALVAVAQTAGFLVGSASTTLGIGGMYCASCVAMLEQALRQLPGVLEATVNLATEQAHVTYVPGLVSLTGFATAITQAGYTARPAVVPAAPALEREEQDREREYTTLLHKLWFAVAIAVPVVIFSYPQFVPGLQTVMRPGSSTQHIIWGLLGVLTLPVLVWSGNQFFVGMWQALRHRQANMNTLIATGTAAAWLYSTVAVLFPGIFPTGTSADVFYDIAAVVTAFILLGLLLELKAKGRTSDALKKLVGLQAKTARVRRSATDIDVPIEEVVVGDIVVVRPGEKVPVDGIIVSGD